MCCILHKIWAYKVCLPWSFPNILEGDDAEVQRHPLCNYRQLACQQLWPPFWPPRPFSLTQRLPLKWPLRFECVQAVLSKIEKEGEINYYQHEKNENIIYFCFHNSKKFPYLNFPLF